MSVFEARTIGFKKISATNASAVVPEGFISASFQNLGDADGTLTQDGQSITLAAGAVFNLPPLDGNITWKAVTVNGTGTNIECVYF
jgi:hypothetical protein